GACQQDGAYRLGVAGQGRDLSGSCDRGSVARAWQWEIEVAYVRSRTAGVMTTLMRNGRDRRSENPVTGQAQNERVSLFGTDQRITPGPAAKKRPHEKAGYMTAPDRFAESQIPLAPRTPSIHDPQRTCWPSVGSTLQSTHDHPNEPRGVRRDDDPGWVHGHDTNARRQVPSMLAPEFNLLIDRGLFRLPKRLFGDQDIPVATANAQTRARLYCGLQSAAAGCSSESPVAIGYRRSDRRTEEVVGSRSP